MSQQVEQWPPADLINGLAIETPPAETELDLNVSKGKQKTFHTTDPKA